MIAFVGSYTSPTDPAAGGIAVVEVSGDGAKLTTLSTTPEPREAGYLVYAPSTRTLYAVDERKTDGRGPGPVAAVHALQVSADGSLTWMNSRPAPGPFPTYLSVDEQRHVLVSANHGDFGHVERIVRTADGGWGVDYVFDDSAVLVYNLEPDGTIGALRDVQVMSGHGQDPNSSPQANGHAQATGHAHCAVFDPSGQFLLVADKGTDQIHTYTLDDTLELISTYQFPAETGPRHIAFDPVTGLGFVTCEFASDLASFALDATGRLRVLDRVSTLSAGYPGPNEPADVQAQAGIVYVNNRGEDSLAWFTAHDDGALSRRGHISLATSLHPGVAARSFAIDPSGAFLLVADRPADLVRSYAVDPADGALTALTDIRIPQPACIAFAELSTPEEPR